MRIDADIKTRLENLHWLSSNRVRKRNRTTDDVTDEKPRLIIDIDCEMAEIDPVPYEESRRYNADEISYNGELIG